MRLLQSTWHGMASKKMEIGQVGSKLAVKCAFQVAVENTEDVKNGFCPGKQAIKNADRNKVDAADSKCLQGSLDIDSQVKELYPDAPRWDYALSYDDKIYFFEVHPAETSEVDKVISKVKWLRNWLKTKATDIDKLPKAANSYTWVPSGRYAILSTANVMRRLSASGIVVVKRLQLE